MNKKIKLNKLIAAGCFAFLAPMAGQAAAEDINLDTEQNSANKTLTLDDLSPKVRNIALAANNSATLKQALNGTDSSYTLSTNETVTSTLGAVGTGKPNNTFTISGNKHSVKASGTNIGGITIDNGQTLNIENVGSMNADGTVKDSFSGFRNANGTGGVLAFLNGSTGTIKNSVFSGNSAITNSAVVHGVYAAGAIYNRENLSIEGSTFINNSAAVGQANTYSAGALFNRGNISLIKNTDFINNTSYASASGTIGGGAIWNDEVATISQIVDVDFTGNKADTDGGGILNKGTIGTISANFSGNSVKNFGGAIYNKGTIGTLSGTFEDNTAVRYGGAIYHETGSITDISGAFNNNSASYGGGAIVNKASITNLSADFQGNESGTGGAISNVGGTIKTLSGDFVDNNAERYGGAIATSGTINSIEGEFRGNTAGTYGGAIYNASAGKIYDISGDFIGNSATEHAGAIYNDGGIITKISGLFAGNSATTRGGAIRNTGGTISNLSGTFIGNQTSSYDGGAIYNSNGTINIVADVQDTTFTGNIVNADTTPISNAIHNFSGSTLNLNAGAGSIIVNDGVISVGTMNINKSDVRINSADEAKAVTAPINGVVEFNNKVSGSGKINLYNGTLKFGHHEEETIEVPQADGTTKQITVAESYGKTTDTINIFGGTLDLSDNIATEQVLGLIQTSDNVTFTLNGVKATNYKDNLQLGQDNAITAIDSDLKINVATGNLAVDAIALNGLSSLNIQNSLTNANKFTADAVTVSGSGSIVNTSANTLIDSITTADDTELTLEGVKADNYIGNLVLGKKNTINSAKSDLKDITVTSGDTKTINATSGTSTVDNVSITSGTLNLSSAANSTLQQNADKNVTLSDGTITVAGDGAVKLNNIAVSGSSLISQNDAYTGSTTLGDINLAQGSSSSSKTSLTIALVGENTTASDVNMNGNSAVTLTAKAPASITVDSINAYNSSNTMTFSQDITLNVNEAINLNSASLALNANPAAINANGVKINGASNSLAINASNAKLGLMTLNNATVNMSGLKNSADAAANVSGLVLNGNNSMRLNDSNAGNFEVKSGDEFELLSNSGANSFGIAKLQSGAADNKTVLDLNIQKENLSGTAVELNDNTKLVVSSYNSGKNVTLDTISVNGNADINNKAGILNVQNGSEFADAVASILNIKGDLNAGTLNVDNTADVKITTVNNTTSFDGVTVTDGSKLTLDAQGLSVMSQNAGSSVSLANGTLVVGGQGTVKLNGINVNTANGAEIVANTNQYSTSTLGTINVTNSTLAMNNIQEVGANQNVQEVVFTGDNTLKMTDTELGDVAMTAGQELTFNAVGGANSVGNVSMTAGTKTREPGVADVVDPTMLTIGNTSGTMEVGTISMNGLNGVVFEGTQGSTVNGLVVSGTDNTITSSGTLKNTGTIEFTGTDATLSATGAQQLNNILVKDGNSGTLTADASTGTSLFNNLTSTGEGSSLTVNKTGDINGGILTATDGGTLIYNQYAGNGIFTGAIANNGTLQIGAEDGYTVSLGTLNVENSVINFTNTNCSNVTLKGDNQINLNNSTFDMAEVESGKDLIVNAGSDTTSNFGDIEVSTGSTGNNSTLTLDAKNNDLHGESVDLNGNNELVTKGDYDVSIGTLDVLGANNIVTTTTETTITDFVLNGDAVLDFNGSSDVTITNTTIAAGSTNVINNNNTSNVSLGSAILGNGMNLTLNNNSATGTLAFTNTTLSGDISGIVTNGNVSLGDATIDPTSGLDTTNGTTLQTIEIANLQQTTPSPQWDLKVDTTNSTADKIVITDGSTTDGKLDFSIKKLINQATDKFVSYIKLVDSDKSVLNSTSGTNHVQNVAGTDTYYSYVDRENGTFDKNFDYETNTVRVTNYDITNEFLDFLTRQGDRELTLTDPSTTVNIDGLTSLPNMEVRDNVDNILTIQGTGALIAKDVNDTSIKLFTVDSTKDTIDRTLNLNGLTVTDAYSSDNGGVVDVKSNETSGAANVNIGMYSDANPVFENNEAANDGGVIHSTGEKSLIKIIADKVTFKNNKAGANGGAIANKDGSVMNIESNAEFENNTATNGGAILNDNATLKIGKDENSTVTFKNNKAIENGGAIASRNNDLEVLGNVTYDSNSANQKGGALSAEGSDITMKGTQTFVNNTAGEKGGALYAKDAIINLHSTREGKLSLFKGNTAKGENNAVYLDGGATLNLVSQKDTGFVFEDKIAGTKDNTIIQNGGSVYYNNDNSAYQGNFQLLAGEAYFTNANSKAFAGGDYLLNGGTTLHLANNRIDTIKANSLDLSGTNANNPANITIDMDLTNEISDRFDLANSTSGNILVTGINTTGTTEKENLFFDIAQGAQVDSSVKEVIANYYNYDVKGGNGGLTLQRKNLSDTSLLAPQVAANARLANQLAMYNQLLQRVDEIAEYRYFNKVNRTNLYASVHDVVDNTFTPYVNQEDGGTAWVKPSVTLESINPVGQDGYNNKAYNTIIGYDTPVATLGNGWEMISTIFGGYQGSYQDYDNVKNYQNGGVGGYMANIYKDNFFAGGVVMAGGANVEVNDSGKYGRNMSYGMFDIGAAARVGYNVGLGKHWLFQPMFTTSYTYISGIARHNQRGEEMDMRGTNTIQITPGFKLVGNYGGWQPYVLLDYTWPIMSKTLANVNNIDLPDVGLRSYIEYGVGLRKNIGERFTGQAEAVMRNGGRSGVSLQGGFIWKF